MDYLQVLSQNTDPLVQELQNYNKIDLNKLSKKERD